LAKVAIKKAMQRVEARLAQEPWQEPEQRLASKIADAIAAPKIRKAMDAEEAFEKARWTLADKRQNAGLLRRFLPTYRRELRELKAAVEQAERDMARDGYTRADQRADEEHVMAVAKDRNRERRDWLDKPEIKEVIREAEELKLASDAIQKGDPQIVAAAACGDVRKARELAVNNLGEQQRREFEERMAGYVSGGPRPGAGGKK
jgi:hypothetical protein